MPLPHFVRYSEITLDLYCIVTNGVGDCRDGEYEFVFKKGEKYKAKTREQLHNSGMFSYSVLPTDNNHGANIRYCSFGTTNSTTDGYVWDYFENLHERRKRVIKKILDD